jgi:hypothetical protein
MGQTYLMHAVRQGDPPGLIDEDRLVIQLAAHDAGLLRSMI